MTNTEQTKRDCIKLIKNRAHRLCGGCSEFPLRKLLAHVVPCTRTVLMQSARIGVNLKGTPSWILPRFEKIHTSLFSKHFSTWSLKCRESPCGALPNSDFSSRLSGFVLETCGDRKSVHGQTRRDVLSLFSLHSHCVFISSCGSSYTGKEGSKNVSFSAVYPRAAKQK